MSTSSIWLAVLLVLAGQGLAGFVYCTTDHGHAAIELPGHEHGADSNVRHDHAGACGHARSAGAGVETHDHVARDPDSRCHEEPADCEDTALAVTATLARGDAQVLALPPRHGPITHAGRARSACAPLPLHPLVPRAPPLLAALRTVVLIV